MNDKPTKELSPEAKLLLAELPNFTGTEAWHRYSPLFKYVLLTDGAKYLAEQAGAFWLMDVIGSHQHVIKRMKDWSFQVWKLSKDENGEFEVTATDGNDNQLIYQHIGYSDFPLDEYELFAQYSGNNLVILLKSEY